MSLSVNIHHKTLPEPPVSITKGQRTALLSVLIYEGLGALVGGGLLIAAPDGHLMDMPISILHGAFSSFLIPGIILLLMGLLNVAAFVAVYIRTQWDWVYAMAATIGMLIWFWIEIAILQQLHWLHAMWGLPVVLGFAAGLNLVPDRILQKGLLYSGILASLLYLVINIIVPLQWKGYSFSSQVISELSAFDSPTRTLWNILVAPYSLLILAFAIGVYRAAADNKQLRKAGKLLIAYAALGLLWPFAPMHMRLALYAGASSFSDTMHIILGAVTEILFLITLRYAAMALGKSFLNYSFITFLILLAFGMLTFLDAPGIARNEPTPYIGIWERVNIGLFLVWTIVFSITLTRRKELKQYAINKAPHSRSAQAV